MGDTEGVPVQLAVALELAETVWLRDPVSEAVLVDDAVCVGVEDTAVLPVPEAEGDAVDDAVCDESCVPA